MNNFSSYQKSKTFFVLVVTIVLFLVSSLGIFSPVQQWFSLQVAPAVMSLKSNATSVDNFVSSLQNLQATEIENQSLKLQIESLNSQLEELQTTKLQLSTIQQEHNILSQSLPPSILATVIKYSDSPNIGYLYVYLAGSSIKVDQFAVSKGYVVGQVVEVTGLYAKIRLLTSPDTQLNVRIGANQVPAVLRGKSGLSLIINEIKIDTPVNIGDPIYFYQSSSFTDWGYKLGNVTQINKLEVQGEKELQATSGIDLNNLKFVFIYPDVL